MWRRARRPIESPLASSNDLIGSRHAALRRADLERSGSVCTCGSWTSVPRQDSRPSVASRFDNGTCASGEPGSKGSAG